MQEHCPPKTSRHSLLVTRRRFSAQQEPRPPNFLCPLPLAPFKVEDGEKSVVSPLVGDDCLVVGVKPRRYLRHSATLSPFATRHSLFRHLLSSIRYSPFAVHHSPVAIRCRYGSAGTSPSHFSRPSSHDPRPVKSRRSFSASSTTG